MVDIVLHDGECAFASVTDNWPATRSFEVSQGKFNETGASSPSLLPPDHQAELVELGVATTKALGFRCGVFCLNVRATPADGACVSNAPASRLRGARARFAAAAPTHPAYARTACACVRAQLKYTSRGARLIEVNSRMGGMFVRDHNKLCWGVDLVTEHLLATVGVHRPPPKAEKPLRASAGIYVSAEASGVVSNVDVLREHACAKEYTYFHPMVEVGDEVLGPADASDFPTWLCGFMLSAPNAEMAIARAKAVNDDVVARVGLRA